MADTDVPSAGPPATALDGVFHVYDAQTDGERLLYYGEPLVPRDHLERTVWPAFRNAGYEVRMTLDGTQYVLIAEPTSVGVDGIPWTNILLGLATVLTTLYAGSMWYHADLAADPANVLKGWPFMVAIMGVLGIHELGHYVLSRYHEVDASLPYFIPVPISFIGTFGAVIRMKGRMPDRTALFDIGVAGPLAGLVATVIVTVIGLYLPPVTAPPEVMHSANVIQVEFGYPLLIHILAWVTGQPLHYADPAKSVNPVVIAGWVGTFVTFLNLIPVGQLDGGHILRSMLGREQDRISVVVPVVLFGLAGGLYYFNVAGNAVAIWAFWGVITSFFTFVGSATPVDEASLDSRRVAIGVLTFVLGILCFNPVPIQVIT